MDLYDYLLLLDFAVMMACLLILWAVWAIWFLTEQDDAWHDDDPQGQARELADALGIHQNVRG
jgi:hypothetical protein